jgi:hypothetical protein
MKWLTNRFLKLSIHRQVQVGIIGVSLSVCLSVLCLLFFNTFLLINLAYTDIVQVLNFKEDQYIENCAMNLDSQVVILFELGKQNVQVLRNFIQNNKRNQDFVNNLANMDIPTSGNTICDYKNLCANYKILIPEALVYPQPSFQLQLKIVKSILPLLDRIYKTRFFEKKYTAQPLFEEVSIMDNVHNAIFFYPNFTLDDSYNITKFKKSIAVLTNITSTLYNPQMISSNMIADPFNLNKTMATTPFISALIPGVHYELPYNDKNLFQGLLFSTFSSLYKQAGTYDNVKLANYTNIIDIVLGNWRVNTLDYYTQENAIKFKGLRILGTRADNSIALNSITCNMFRSLYNFQNNLTVPSAVLPMLADCFLYDKGNSTFFKVFGITNSTDYLYHERRARIPLINNYLDTGSDDQGIEYKVFRYFFPYITTKITIKSNFYFNINFMVYFLQDQSHMRYKQTFLFYKATSVIIMAMFYSWTLWYLVLLAIGIILIRTIDKISNPINSLIQYVTCSFGQEGTQPQKLSIDNIEFKDDSDINDLFQICRSLIKGGFSEEIVLANSDNGLNAYNNISYVKSNNLIIQEDIIESQTEDANNLFRYKQNDEEQVKLVEDKGPELKSCPTTPRSRKIKMSALKTLRKTWIKNSSILARNSQMEKKEVHMSNNEIDNFYYNNIQNLFNDEFMIESNNYVNDVFKKVSNDGKILKIIKI